MNDLLKIAIGLIGLFPLVGNCQTTTYSIRIHDTRDVADSPSAFNRIARFDFKRRATVGVPGAGVYSGQITIAPWADNTGGRHHQVNFNDGGIFYRTGRPDDAAWGSWKRLVIENANGNVGIGTVAPDAKLTVNGNIHAREVKVDLAGAVAPDYDFEEGYPLRSLEEVQSFIADKGHLPGIPSADEMEKEGINLKEMNLKLLEKVEELTLHLIEQKKNYRRLEKQMLSLQKEITTLKTPPIN